MDEVGGAGVWGSGERQAEMLGRGGTYLQTESDQSPHASLTCTSEKDKIMDTAWRALGLATGAMQ